MSVAGASDAWLTPGPDATGGSAHPCRLRRRTGRTSDRRRTAKASADRRAGRSTRRLFTISARLAGACCLLLLGCAAPPTEPRAELPQLDELAPASDSAVIAQPAALSPTATHRLLIKRIAFDLRDARVDLALEGMPPADLPEPLLARWRANGLDIRRIPLDRLEMVLANLPRPRRTQTIAHRSAGRYAPLTLVSNLPDAHAVRYTDAEGRTRVKKLYGGEHRFMIRLGEGDIRKAETGPALDLLPHHYGPRRTLLLRSREERMLDGVSFDALRVNHPIPERTVWAIWSPLHYDDDDEEADGAESGESGEPTGTGDGEKSGPPKTSGPAERGGAESVHAAPLGPEEVAVEVEMPPGMRSEEGASGEETPAMESRAREEGEGPPRLGRAMLTGRQGNRAVRLVLLLTVRSLGGSEEGADTGGDDADANGAASR